MARQPGNRWTTAPELAGGADENSRRKVQNVLTDSSANVRGFENGLWQRMQAVEEHVDVARVSLRGVGGERDPVLARRER